LPDVRHPPTGELLMKSVIARLKTLELAKQHLRAEFGRRSYLKS
jgi:hypothetical protein